MPKFSGIRHIKKRTPLSPYAVYEVDGELVVWEKGKKPVIISKKEKRKEK